MFAKRVSVGALIIVATVSLSTALVEGGFWETSAGHSGPHTLTTQDVAGFTKIGFTADYLVIVNVLPGEEMYSVEEVDQLHPTIGEMVLVGTGSGPIADSRHVEAHVYDRSTGMPITNLTPTIEVTNQSTGEVFAVESVLMQDVAIGKSDLHFGDNVAVPGRSQLTVRVVFSATEEVVVNGFLS